MIDLGADGLSPFYTYTASIYSNRIVFFVRVNRLEMSVFQGFE